MVADPPASDSTNEEQTTDQALRPIAPSERSLPQEEAGLRPDEQPLQAKQEDAMRTREELQAANQELRAINQELQKQTEEELRRSEDRYRTLFESIDEGFCTIEVLFDENDTPFDYRFLEVNPAFERQTGLKDAAGKRMRELVPTHEAHWLEIYGKVALTGEAIRFEDRAAALNRWYGVYAFRVGLPEDRRVGILCNDISHRKAAEEALRTSEARLRRALSIETVGVMFFKVKGTITDANDAFLRMSGYSAEDLAAGHVRWDTMTPPEFMPQSLQAIEELKTLGQTTPYEKQYIRKDGSRWWGLFAAKRLGEEEAVKFIIDITETKRAEVALRASEEQMRLLLESVQDYAIFTLDTMGRVTSWNEGARRITGYMAQEIIGQPVQRFYIAEDIAAGKPEHEMQTALSVGRSEDESWRVHKDGSRFWANEIMTPLRAADGILLGFTKVTRDLSQRRAAEEALRASEERLRVTMQSITDYAIITHDPEGKITGWNVGAEQIFGYTAVEVLGQPSAIIFTPEDRERGVPEQELATARAQGRAEDERWHLRKDGSRFFASGVMVPLQADGVAGFVKVARDLTQRRQWEERLEAQVKERTRQVRALVTQLTMSEQEERRRISSILHDDLQQHLYGLDFQLTLLRRMLDNEEQENAQQLIAEINEALRETVQLTRHLSVDLSPPVLHNEGLMEAIRWLAVQMEQQQGLAVEMQTEGATFLLNEDLRVLLFQSVRELLFNIVKHAKVNTASVTLAPEDDYLRIEVSDQGQGFDPHAPTSQNSQGLLRIQQRLQLLGGRMQISSTPRQGTRVILYVPFHGQNRE